MSNEIQPGVVGVVLVEGPDDVAFFRLLIEVLGLKALLQVIPLNGGDRNQLKRQLLLRTNDPLYDELKTIGIVWDADGHRDRREQSLKAVLTEVPIKPAVSYLIMPPAGEGTNRMLEDVLWRYFEEEKQPFLACVDQYIECLATLPPESWPPRREAKTRFYALIAAQKDPTDEATRETFRRYITNFDSPAFATLKTFLTQLTA
jgi:hypothetical protein